jgi:hypothetical protein
MGIVTMRMEHSSNVERPRLIVIGSGRCGSSLAMQMLAAAGVPVTGEAPTYEATAGRRPHLLTEAQYAGKAVKVLDAEHHAGAIPWTMSARWVWTRRRSHHEQAKSQRKFGALFGVDVPWSKLPQLEASLAASDRETQQFLAKRAEPFIEMWFEDVLKEPVLEALRLMNFLRQEMRMVLPMSSATDAADQVVKRTPECMPGFLELDMTRAAMAARRAAS